MGGTTGTICRLQTLLLILHLQKQPCILPPQFFTQQLQALHP